MYTSLIYFKLALIIIVTVIGGGYGDDGVAAYEFANDDVLFW